LYGDNNDALTPVILVKPDKGVDMDAFKAELAQKLEIIAG
jgi:putative ABC transport system permease protein